jgi:hypothetical protein
MAVDRYSGLDPNLGRKAPVRVATLGNITLSGVQTIDGVALSVGDRVLVRAQTSGVQNGIYDVKSGAWTRSADFDRDNDVVAGTSVMAGSGSTYGGSEFYVSTTNPQVGVGAIAFTRRAGGDPGAPGATGAAAAPDAALFETRAAIVGAAITLPGLGGPKIIRTGGYATYGDGGHGVYKYRAGGAPSDPTNPAYVSANSGTLWFELVPDPFVNVLQFGFKADYVRNGSSTDNLAAFGHVEAFVTSVAPHCWAVLVPPGKFYFSGTTEITGGQQKWIGAGSGREPSSNEAAATQFYYPPNTAGIIVARGNTHLNGLAGTPGRGGDGSIIEGIALFSESDGWPSAVEVNATYTATNTEPAFSGLTGSGLRDGADASSSTVWGTATSSGGSITADLGGTYLVSTLMLRPIPSSFGGWGALYLNGATVEVSTNGSSWTTVGTVSGMVDGVAKRVDMGVDVGTISSNQHSRTCRYIRLTKTGSFFGLAEFRVLARPSDVEIGFDGFWLRARAELRDVQAIGFPRDGLNVTAASDGGAYTLGNANLWNVRDFTFNFNGRAGIFARGADANAGRAEMGNCSFNGQWGAWDISFLKNTWLALHAESNGHATGTMNAWYGGKVWLLRPGTEFYSATTTPGTDSSVWDEWYDAAAPDAWSVLWEGQEFLSNGPFASAGGTWLGIYCEAGQAPVHMTNGAHFRPIINECGYTPQSLHPITQDGGDIVVNGRFWNGVTTGPHANAGFFTGLGDNQTLGTIVRVLDNEDGAGTNWELRMRLTDTQDIAFDAGASTRGYTGLRSLTLTSPTTTSTFGRTNPVPNAAAPNRLILPGNVEVTSGTAAPTTGERKRGDVCWNANVTSGQPEGWRCTASGTPGTWSAMANHP